MEAGRERDSPPPPKGGDYEEETITTAGRTFSRAVRPASKSAVVAVLLTTRVDSASGLATIVFGLDGWLFSVRCTPRLAGVVLGLDRLPFLICSTAGFVSRAFRLHSAVLDGPTGFV